MKPIFYLQEDCCASAIINNLLNKKKCKGYINHIIHPKNEPYLINDQEIFAPFLYDDFTIVKDLEILLKYINARHPVPDLLPYAIEHKIDIYVQLRCILRKVVSLDNPLLIAKKLFFMWDDVKKYTVKYTGFYSILDLVLSSICIFLYHNNVSFNVSVKAKTIFTDTLNDDDILLY